MAAMAQEKQKKTESYSETATGAANSSQQPKKTVSRKVGIVIMAVMLVLSLFIGNFRALQKATPTAFLRQGDVKSIVEDRANAATNAMTVAKRSSADTLYINAVESANKAFSSAKTARELSRANQELTAAVSEAVAEAQKTLSADDQKMLTRAMDTFTEQGSFLRQEAREYNSRAEKAVKLYESLPTRFLLSEPDYYEGISQ